MASSFEQGLSLLTIDRDGEFCLGRGLGSTALSSDVPAFVVSKTHAGKSEIIRKLTQSDKPAVASSELEPTTSGARLYEATADARERILVVDTEGSDAGVRAVCVCVCVCV
jgi:hypothetical protein